MLTTFASYRLISADIERSISRTSAQPFVKREVEHYTARIGEIKNIDDFLKDDRVFRFAMKAHGLEDMAYAKAFIRKLLFEGVESPGAMANRLSDRRYFEFASSFNFERYGPLTTSSEAARGGTVAQYLRQTLEEQAGTQNEGVRLALHFQRKAPGLTSGYAIMADPALLKVAQVALGLPVGQKTDVDATARLIEKRLPLADLSDNQKVHKFLQRFTALWDLNYNPGRAGPATLFSSADGRGISIDLLFSIQNIRLNR